MISIVLYGRNDAYGYNLHKRAALSLNCMAEMLTDADDEILFVDYNTPDDLPTFPEAIHDTLTAKAKERLRIFRVRPAVHAQYRERTHLLTVEPVARNVAVRRSNERNPWILSTNTDMIFVPRAAGSLSEIVRDVPPGWYGIPRFELPEGLWESFDRLDAPGTIAAVRHWAKAAHLNEIIYGAPTIIYDAPGDFQLMRRSDLFDINAFDEAMLLGWHVDSNIAKRLALARGAAGSLVDKVFGYHCDHTRQATPMHSRRDRPANDMSVFISGVDRAELPAQRFSWGCADDPIEEIHLASGSKTQFMAMLTKVLLPAASETTEAYYTDTSYNALWYEAAHVLPFLTDLLMALPDRTAIGWTGIRRDMFDLFRQAMKELGFSAPILVSRESAARLVTDSTAGVEILDESVLLNRADLLIFEFGLARDDASSARDARYGAVLDVDDEKRANDLRMAFTAAITRERIRQSASMEPRRFVAINCIGNMFEPLVMANLGASLTPYSTRIRQGFVLPVSIDRQTWIAATLADLTSQAAGIGEPELASIRRFVHMLLDGVPIDEFDRVRLGVVADALSVYLDLPEARDIVGTDIAKIARVRHGLVQHTELHRGFETSSVRIVDARTFASPKRLSRLASNADWDDPLWSHWVEKLGLDAGALSRSGATWWRTHVCHGLDHLGLLANNSSAMIVAKRRDPFFTDLARNVRAVRLFDVHLLTGGTATSRSVAKRLGHHRRVKRLSLAGRKDSRGDSTEGYQIAVLMPGVGLGDGPTGFVQLRRRLDPLLADNAVLVIVDEVVLAGGASTGTLAIEDLPVLHGALTLHTGLKPLDAIDPEIVEVDRKRVLGPIGFESYHGAFLTRSWWRARRGKNRRRVPTDLPYFGHVDESGLLRWPFVWFLRKMGPTIASGWNGVMATLARDDDENTHPPEGSG